MSFKRDALGFISNTECRPEPTLTSKTATDPPSQLTQILSKTW